VAPAFTASTDFAIDKPAGRPCPQLRSDLRCDIHADLRGQGFAGCAVFDCFGAGQQVVEVTFAGRHWREGAEHRRVDVRGVLDHAAAEGAALVLVEALARLPSRALAEEVGRAEEENRRLVHASTPSSSSSTAQRTALSRSGCSQSQRSLAR
jgi:hypothetical protein